MEADSQRRTLGHLCVVWKCQLTMWPPPPSASESHQRINHCIGILTRSCFQLCLVMQVVRKYALWDFVYFILRNRVKHAPSKKTFSLSSSLLLYILIRLYMNKFLAHVLIDSSYYSYIYSSIFPWLTMVKFSCGFKTGTPVCCLTSPATCRTNDISLLQFSEHTGNTCKTTSA